MSWLLPILLLLSTLLQLYFWIYLFGLLARRSPDKSSEAPPLPPISLIVCARNEEANLRRHLEHWLAQDYPEYELLIVDDASTDGSRVYLREMAGRHPRLRVLHLEDKPEGSGKKYALEAGIRAARHDWLLLTDADCRPASRYWMREMAASTGGQTEIVLGYSPYEQRPGMLNRFIRFEAAYTAVQYLSFALAGQPYMGVGRNLLYRRALWERAGGFASHQDLAGGDDDLFVSAAARGGNTAVCLAPRAFVWTRPAQSWSAYYHQKQRHVSTAVRYGPRHRLMLSLLGGSHFFHYLLIFTCFFQKLSIVFALVLYIIRTIVLLLRYLKIFKKLQAPDLWGWVPVLDLVYTLYYCALLPFIFKNQTNYWK